MNGGLIKSCELVSRVRSGRVVKAGSNGIVLYNAAWLEQHAELRGSGKWLDIGGVYKCSVCGCIEEWGYDYCRNCGSKMEEDEKRKRGTWRVYTYGEMKYYMCSECASFFTIKHIRCPICKSPMYCGLKNGKEEREE